MQTTAITIEGLHKSFTRPGHDPVRAVRGIDLTIRTGEVVAILGPNGAGKTTTLDMVLGLTTPTSGSVEVFGIAPRAAVSAGRVSAVLQSGGLLRDLTVSETVQMIAATFPDHAPVDAVLERAGIRHISQRLVSKCSGGEQQRLRFALSLLPDPDLLVLDEPTAGMDVTARREFWAAMHAEAAEGRTVVFATHYLTEADDFADRIIVIADGRVVADGTTAEIRRFAADRTVSAVVADRATALARLEALPVVVDARFTDDRVVVRATDSDVVARLLLTELDATDLLVASGDLEDAFVSLLAPADHPTGVPA